MMFYPLRKMQHENEAINDFIKEHCCVETWPIMQSLITSIYSGLYDDRTINPNEFKEIEEFFEIVRRDVPISQKM